MYFVRNSSRYEPSLGSEPSLVQEQKYKSEKDIQSVTKVFIYPITFNYYNKYSNFFLA